MYIEPSPLSGGERKYYIRHKYKNYFFGFIGSPQQMMSQASTQPQTSSTETTSPQARHENLLPFLTASFFVVLFLAVVVFLAFVAKVITPFVYVHY